MTNALPSVQQAARAAVRSIRQLPTQLLALPFLALLLLVSSTNTAQAQGTVLQWWPLKVNNQDSAAVRAAQVNASTSTLRRLYTSNGTTIVNSITLPPYSPKFGQAFGPTSNGDGTWTTVGGNLNRGYYEQFTVTTTASGNVRVDSLVASSAFYNTSSSTKLAVVYSKSNFTADSADVTGGKGPAGPLAATANGAFATPIILANQTAGPSNTYRLALNGATGVTLAPGQTLSIRLYYCCSSTSAGRYGMLKNVMAKGAVTAAACNAAFSYATASFCQSGANPTPTITGTTGGTFSSTTGLSIDASTGAITLASSTPGTYTVTYTASASCSSTATVTISGSQSAVFSYAASAYCTSATASQAAVLATGSTAGTFSSTTGLTLNATTGAITPSTSTPGTYTVTNSVAASGSCTATSSTTTVTITAAPLANIGYSAPAYCTSTAGSVALNLGTGSTRGTVTVAPATGLTIDATGTITPSTSTPGTYFVTNTVAAAGGCAAVSGGTTVTITAPQTAAFAYGTSATFCVNGGINPSPTLSSGATAGTFSSTAGLSLNATTGTITAATSTPGTYTVTNTVAASGGCAAVTATTTVTIAPAPSAAFSYANAAYCASGANAAATVTGATGGTFSVAPATGLMVDASTGALTLAGSTAGTYTVTYTVAGTCSASSTQTVTINALPATPTLTSSGTPTTGILLTSSASTGNQFYLNGVLIPGATAQTYLINSGTRNGTYTVTTTNAAGCTSAASAPVSVAVTATRSAANGPALSLYPNPTPNGQLHVELTGNTKAVELTVLNALGQLVYRQNVAGAQPVVLDLSALPAGVYVLQGRSADGTTVRRFVRE